MDHISGMWRTAALSLVLILAACGGPARSAEDAAERKKKIEGTRTMIVHVLQGVTSWGLNNREYCPRSLGQLWRKGFITVRPVDLWDEPLVFKCPGLRNSEGADIVSKGPDKELGTDDDINSWELVKEAK